MANISNLDAAHRLMMYTKQYHHKPNTSSHLFNNHQKTIQHYFLIRSNTKTFKRLECEFCVLNSTNFHIPLCVITKEPSSWGFLEVNLFIKNLKTEFTRAVSNVFFNLKRVFSLKCVFSAIFALVLILIQSFWVFSRECYLLSMLILSYIFNYFYSV